MELVTSKYGNGILNMFRLVSIGYGSQVTLKTGHVYRIQNDAGKKTSTWWKANTVEGDYYFSSGEFYFWENEGKIIMTTTADTSGNALLSGIKDITVKDTTITYLKGFLYEVIESGGEIKNILLRYCIGGLLKWN